MAKSARTLRTVRRSKTLVAILVAGTFKAVAWLTDWLPQLWDVIVWAVGALPDVAGEVKTTLVTTEEVAKWFKIDWGAVSLWVTGVLLAVVFLRHLADKQELEEKRAAEETAGT
jgi:hypothetical protein